jgi:prephenate dehydrogenase
MTTEIAIFGLGRVGASLALALRAKGKEAGLQVSGYDRDADRGREAKARGMLDRAEWGLSKAAAAADLAILAVPLSELRELLSAMAPSLRQDAVALSLAPLLGPPLAWAAEAAANGAGWHFVAGHPALNPEHLHSGEAGLEAATADLFARGLWTLAPASDCPPEALRLAADLAHLAGAEPYYVDPAEHDGLAAASEGLPAMLAWALLQAAAASPGWDETRKLAERAFATATAALAEPEAAALRLNRENALRYLDAATAELDRLRDWLARGDDLQLEAALAEAAGRRAEWLAQRKRGEWDAPGQPSSLPGAREELGRMLLGGLFKRTKK